MIDAVNRATAEMDWATFMNRPTAYIDVARLAACFGGSIRIPLCERLLAAGRLQERLSNAICEFYALTTPVGPDAANAVDQRIALLSASRTRDLVRRAGAVYWANTIANAIRADEVRQLRSRLGDGLYAFAVTNRHLSERSGRLDLADATDAQIDEDGWRCLGGWCESQHKAISERVLLKRPPSPALDGSATSPFTEIGSAIVRCAVV